MTLSKDLIYQEGIQAYPQSAELHGNYAIFLYTILKKYDKAEEYYLKALELEPNQATLNSNYAGFLCDTQREYDKAEEYYLKALELEPNHAHIHGNYAVFLKNIRKEYNSAERHYRKALISGSNHAYINNNYAVFLSHIKKEYNRAEKYYLQALKLDTQNANIHGNYAQQLLQTNEKEKAKYYIKKAFEINNIDDNTLNIELWFYRLAHFPEYFEEAQRELDRLLAKGIRSIGWNFDGNIKRAQDDGFKNIELLHKYASMITQE